ncbi:MAG: hypothetical protein AAB649_04110, partial [Patescibacteria group bacterium]
DVAPTGEAVYLHYLVASLAALAFTMRRVPLSCSGRGHHARRRVGEGRRLKKNAFDQRILFFVQFVSGN